MVLASAGSRAAAQAASDAEPAANEAALAQARQLFTEGVAHTQAQEWEAAADSFRRALALHAAPTIRYNLAAALVELGEYREASSELESVLADTETSDAIRELGDQLRQRIQTESGRLRIETTGDREGAEITLDAEPLDDAWLAREIPVRPGDHTVAATRDGLEIAQRPIAIQAGESESVQLELGTVSAPSSEVPLLEDWRFWLGVGAGAVVLIVLVSVAAAVASSGSADAVPGNFTPSVITW